MYKRRSIARYLHISHIIINFAVLLTHLRDRIYEESFGKNMGTAPAREFGCIAVIRNRRRQGHRIQEDLRLFECQQIERLYAR